MSAYRQSTGAVPQLKPTILYVLAAFDRGDDGELKPAFQPQQVPSETVTIARAKLMIGVYAGVIAWSRAARPDATQPRERADRPKRYQAPAWTHSPSNRETNAQP
jgi:hypothetical protein